MGSGANERSLNLRIANQSIYHLWAIFLGGLAMLVMAAFLFAGAPSGAADLDASILGAAGILFSVVTGLKITYLKYSALYTVTSDSITARYGLIARKAFQIQVAHVRSITVTQTLTGRLLGYGDLEFASAGSDDGSELVFKSISHPMRTKELVSEMLEKDRSRTTHD